MKFFVYSRGAIEAIKPFNEPHVFISITTTADDKALLPEMAPTKGILRLVFPDADTPSEVNPMETLFSVDHARAVWSFVLEHLAAVKVFVLHCDAGLSRSPAIAAAISKVLVGDDSEFFKRYSPNMRVYRTLLEAWHAEFEVHHDPISDPSIQLRDAIERGDIEGIRQWLRDHPNKAPDDIRRPLSPEEHDRLERLLLERLKQSKARLEEMLHRMSSHWSYEDHFYRFYHQSFKVYRVQETTEAAVRLLRDLLPERDLNRDFAQIIAEGTGKSFETGDNDNWLHHTRPLIEAFGHAKFMVEMAVRYAELPDPPQALPSGWATLLYLFGLR